jgi:L-alanine-DL-glutamate epimerase-like enolase superfamily enzyme
VLAEDWQALAQVRARVDVPIAANEGIWTSHDLTQVIRHQAADIVVMGTQWVGGLWALKKMASAAQMAGMRFCRHCVDSAIGTSAAINVLATMDNLMDGNQFYLPDFIEEVVRGAPPQVEHGTVAISQNPGIGVELDREKLERMRYQPEVHGKMISYYSVVGGTAIWTHLHRGEAVIFNELFRVWLATSRLHSMAAKKYSYLIYYRAVDRSGL